MSEKTQHQEELRLLYQITVSDISYFKSQQWAVTNYTMLIFAGLIGISQMLKPTLVLWERCFLVSISLAASTAGFIVLRKLQRSIVVRQSRLVAAKDSFGALFKQVWAAETKGPEYLHSIYFLYATTFIGGLVSIWLLGFRA